MSDENAELIEALQVEPEVDLVELFRDDQAWANIDATLGPVFHDDVESGFVGHHESRNRGRLGFRQTWLEWLEPWESYRTETDRVIGCGDDVLVLVNDYGRKPGMTAEVRLFGAAVWTVRDGLITRALFYTDREDAFSEVGLDAAILGDE
ncbi:MAG TPA: nuclear transport factor 2 family protein [Thermoleophilaceae bacterium]|nr:nuclear transport factor 2 family protein [Thermoleophilaceae bacterium]